MRSAVSVYWHVLAACWVFCQSAGPVAAEPTIDYLQQVKPLLTEHCTTCHGRLNQENDLRLDTAVTAIQGGISGPAIVPGLSADSLLLKALHGADDVTKMPPEGPGLTADESSLIARWIDEGAKAPPEQLLAPVDSDHWSFQPPRRSVLPSIRNRSWPHNSIDYFILSNLEQRGMQPAHEADRAILIRRLCLDLLGIPPTVEQTDRFLACTQPGAYERLVDRVLASPRYGERWGRHWMDVAHYADSNGYTRDFAREIWPYRDWLISAINRDMSFDEFTIQQIAGDMLPEPSLDQLIATGFYRNTLINEEGGTDPEQFRVDAVADRIATTGAAFLGLTLGCARCHDHKFDPISQREYYQIFAFLNNCDEPTIDAPLPRQIQQGVLEEREAIRKQIRQLEEEFAQRGEEIARQQLAWEKTITPEYRAMLPGPLQDAIDTPVSMRDDAARQLVHDHYTKTDAARKHFRRLEQIAVLRASEPNIPTTMVLRCRSEPRESFIHRRGNFLDPLTRVVPAVPTALHSLPEGTDEPTRLDFARWLVARQNPLTPRVVVNRYWQRFFGAGIVRTENDFGVQGSPATNPRLLDWLAVEFVHQDWSVKSIHRLIVTSATYRQSSEWSGNLLAVDANNTHWARQSRIRLEAEIVRDTALAVSRLLTHEVGGPSVFPPQPDGVFEFTQDAKPWKTETGKDRYRRGMYTFLWRSSPYPAMASFDFPEANTTCTRRVRSNTPLQSLILANDVTFVECARAVAQRVVNRITSHDDTRRARLAHRLCFARQPSVDEVERIVDVARQYRSIYSRSKRDARKLTGSAAEVSDDNAVELAAWTATSRVLMNLDEFVTRE